MKTKRGDPEGVDVKAIRERLNLTQGQLAHKLGVSSTTVVHWEKGEAEPSALARKAIENLLKETPKEKPTENHRLKLVL